MKTELGAYMMIRIQRHLRLTMIQENNPGVMIIYDPNPLGG